jgi:hypothetical protein
MSSVTTVLTWMKTNPSHNSRNGFQLFNRIRFFIFTLLH